MSIEDMGNENVLEVTVKAQDHVVGGQDNPTVEDVGGALHDDGMPSDLAGVPTSADHTAPAEAEEIAASTTNDENDASAGSNEAQAAGYVAKTVTLGRQGHGQDEESPGVPAQRNDQDDEPPGPPAMYSSRLAVFPAAGQRPMSWVAPETGKAGATATRRKGRGSHKELVCREQKRPREAPRPPRKTLRRSRAHPERVGSTDH